VSHHDYGEVPSFKKICALLSVIRTQVYLACYELTRAYWVPGFSGFVRRSLWDSFAASEFFAGGL
jgi:hypothetical protein